MICRPPFLRLKIVLHWPSDVRSEAGRMPLRTVSGQVLIRRSHWHDSVIYNVALMMLVDAAPPLQRLQQQPTMTGLTEAENSAASGVPTFRAEKPLWKRYRPEQLATPEAFKQHPALVCERYA